jgi:pilus assembly protein CpaD
MKPAQRHFRLLIAGAALAALAACAAPVPHPPAHALSETPRTPTVSLVKLTQAIHFRPGQISPDGPQQIDLTRFLRDSEAHRGDTVYIVHGPSAVDIDRAAHLSDDLSARGLGGVVIADDTLPGGNLRVVVERYVAQGPKCPDWSQPNGDKLTNELPSDFGCSNASNLAAMIANPHDLVSGRTMGPAVGDAATRPVERYREGTIPPLGGAASSSGSGSGSGSSSAPASGAGSSGP